MTQTGQPKKSKGERLYFPNLNGLRAIGAGIVMIGHVEFIKMDWGLPAYSWFPVPGKVGVCLFFALSGFLISSLLLQELDDTYTIQLKKFYLRRIFRIWPLYYLVILLSLFVFTQVGWLVPPGTSGKEVLSHLNLTNVIILVCLLPNFTHFLIPYADQRWSIVVEEQFYLFQPFLVRLLRRRERLIAAFIVIIFSPEIWALLIRLTGLNRWISVGITDALGLQMKYLACIAVGCLFSMLFFKREGRLKRLLFSSVTQWGVVACLAAFIVAGFYVYHSDELIDFRVYSFLFAIVVVNASQNPRTIFRLERPLLDFLGKISYGIYMYHPVCIGAALVIARVVTAGGLVVQNIVIYVFSIGLTVLVSWLSFNYFEAWFLRLKSKLHVERRNAAEAVQSPAKL